METQNLTLAESSKADTKGNALHDSLTEAKIQAWIISYIAKLLEIDPDEIDVTVPFDRYGLDSSAAVGLTGDLEDWLGHELDATMLYDYPTVEALTQHLVEELKAKV